MNILAAADQITTTTGIDPAVGQYFTGALGIFFVLLIGLILFATIFLPLFVWGCYNTLRRIEKLHRTVAADIINELRRGGLKQPR